MKIAISINEVLRDFLGQFVYTYNKYIHENTIKENEVTNFNLIEFFKFANIDDLNRFLYFEESLEIFGHADQLIDGVINKFNMLLMDIKDEGEHTIELVSKEFNKSIPSTLFFLSKTGCRIENIRFEQNPENEWGNADILISANPIALNNKPDNKISVKIKSSYNTDASADYELDSILDFINDLSLRNKIINTKITTI